MDYPTVAPVLAEDTLGSVGAPSAPIYDYHADTDEVVPVGQDNTLTKHWCGRGATVQVVRDIIGEHALEGILHLGSTETFISNMFAGARPTNSC